MPKALGLAKIPTLDPEAEAGELPSRYDLSILKVINGNFQLIEAALSGLVTGLEVFQQIASASVLTMDGTSSTVFTDMGSVGPSVAVKTGTHAIVFISAQHWNSTVGNDAYMSVAVSGASTIAANFDNVIMYVAGGGGGSMAAFGVIEGLTPGLNTFTVKYAVSGGVGNWLRRKIMVFPL